MKVPVISGILLASISFFLLTTIEKTRDQQSAEYLIDSTLLLYYE